MSALTEASLIMTLTAYTPREGRETIETRAGMLLSADTVYLLDALIHGQEFDPVARAEMTERARHAVFDDVWALVLRADQAATKAITG